VVSARRGVGAEKVEEFNDHGVGLDKVMYEFGRTEAGS
jgi:hypothetical protein